MGTQLDTSLPEGIKTKSDVLDNEQIKSIILEGSFSNYSMHIIELITKQFFELTGRDLEITKVKETSEAIYALELRHGNTWIHFHEPEGKPYFSRSIHNTVEFGDLVCDWEEITKETVWEAVFWLIHGKACLSLAYMKLREGNTPVQKDTLEDALNGFSTMMLIASYNDMNICLNAVSPTRYEVSTDISGKVLCVFKDMAKAEIFINTIIFYSPDRY